MARVLVTCWAPGEFAREALLSTIVRAWEEFGIEKVVLVYGRSEPSEVVEFLRKVLRIDVVPSHVEEPRARHLHELLERIVREHGVEEVIAAPTPCSRGMACCLGLAASGRLGSGIREPITVINVDFYWGPWRGLPYPFVPRCLEPITILHPGPATPRSTVESIDRVVNVNALLEILNLPRLRKEVALEALKLNREHRGSVRIENGETRCVEPKLLLELVEVQGDRDVKRLTTVVSNWCDPGSWLRAYRWLKEALESELEKVLDLSGPEVRELLSFSGLQWLSVPSGPSIVDTNLVYHGLHNVCWEGRSRDIVLPFCARAEILARYYEAKHGKRSVWVDELAHLGLEELKACGVPVAPSPPPPCDSAIPSMEPLLLDGKKIATLDRRAYEIWRQHPASKLAEPIYAELKSHSDETPLTMARITYAILQMKRVLNTVSTYLKQPSLRLELKPV